VARCSCSGTCSCLILAGAGVTVDGSGQANDPYILTVDAIGGVFKVQDTATVDLTASGAGTADDPFTLSAKALVTLVGLVDRDPSRDPQVGDTPIWQSSGNWKFGPPPVAPAGAVNVGDGLGGTGALDDPLVVATSGTWGTAPLDGLDSTLGQLIYVDVNGQLRAQPLAGQPVAWDSISGKPSTYPSRWDQISGKPAAFPTTWNTMTGKPIFITGTGGINPLAPGEDVTVTWNMPPGSPTIPADAYSTPMVVVSPTTGAFAISASLINGRTQVKALITNVGRSTSPTLTFFNWFVVAFPASQPTLP
jgi:hypothetical protein